MNKKPGEKALDAIKKLNNSVTLFKIPKIPQKKTDKVKILTEEQYVDVSYLLNKFYNYIQNI